MLIKQRYQMERKILLSEGYFVARRSNGLRAWTENGERQSKRARETHPTDGWVSGINWGRKTKRESRRERTGQTDGGLRTDSQTDQAYGQRKMKKEREKRDRQTFSNANV